MKQRLMEISKALFGACSQKTHVPWLLGAELWGLGSADRSCSWPRNSSLKVPTCCESTMVSLPKMPALSAFCCSSVPKDPSSICTQCKRMIFNVAYSPVTARVRCSHGTTSMVHP